MKRKRRRVRRKPNRAGTRPSEVRRDFDRRLQNTIASLPAEIRKLTDAVAIIVEDEPSKELLADFGLDEPPGTSDLCGLHWGTPISKRNPTESNPFPDQIHLFRGPILRLAGRSKGELSRQILITLLHEIGHHFGLDEDRLAELGYD